MKHTERGVHGNSTMAFHVPSTNALDHLYFYNYTGSFYSNRNYYIKRGGKSFDGPYLLMLVLKGNMYLEYEGNLYTAGPGRLLLFNCNLPHCYYTKEDSWFKFIHFGGAESAYFENRLCASGQHVFTGRNLREIDDCFTRLLACTEEPLPNEHSVSALIYQLLVTILTEKEDPGLQDPNHRRINLVIDHMRQHLSEDLSITELAKEQGLAPAYFSRLFRQYTNYSPREYLTGIRIVMAKRLLSETQDSVEKIASQCGFADSAYFIRQFKKQVGITPLRYKKYYLFSGDDLLHEEYNDSDAKSICRGVICE